MKTLLGYSFDGDDVIRHVHLHCYDARRNHDKVYHLVVTLDSSGKFQSLYGIWGRRGSTLRMQKKLGRSSVYAVTAAFDKQFNKLLRECYLVQSDTAFSVDDNNEVSAALDNLETLLPDTIWVPAQYARNPVRAQVVPEDWDFAGYATVLLPSARRRILTLVASPDIAFYNEHGGRGDLPSLYEAVVDLEGQFVIDGYWDGDTYQVFDVFDGNDADDYAARVQTLTDLIDGTVGENVQMATVCLGEASLVRKKARELGMQQVMGIKLNVPERPGLNDGTRIIYALKPRVNLCVMDSTMSGFVCLGLDDGLGMVEVCQMPIPQTQVQTGDVVLVEYESWAGYGHALKDAVFVHKLNAPIDCKIDQLLGV